MCNTCKTCKKEALLFVVVFWEKIEDPLLDVRDVRLANIDFSGGKGRPSNTCNICKIVVTNLTEN